MDDVIDSSDDDHDVNGLRPRGPIRPGGVALTPLRLPWLDAAHRRCGGRVLALSYDGARQQLYTAHRRNGGGGDGRGDVVSVEPIIVTRHASAHPRARPASHFVLDSSITALDSFTVLPPARDIGGEGGSEDVALLVIPRTKEHSTTLFRLAGDELRITAREESTTPLTSPHVLQYLTHAPSDYFYLVSIVDGASFRFQLRRIATLAVMRTVNATCQLNLMRHLHKFHLLPRFIVEAWDGTSLLFGARVESLGPNGNAHHAIYRASVPDDFYCDPNRDPETPLPPDDHDAILHGGKYQTFGRDCILLGGYEIHQSVAQPDLYFHGKRQYSLDNLMLNRAGNCLRGLGTVAAASWAWQEDTCVLEAHDIEPRLFLIDGGFPTHAWSCVLHATRVPIGGFRRAVCAVLGLCVRRGGGANEGSGESQLAASQLADAQSAHGSSWGAMPLELLELVFGHMWQACMAEWPNQSSWHDDYAHYA